MRTPCHEIVHELLKKLSPNALFILITYTDQFININPLDCIDGV